MKVNSADINTYKMVVLWMILLFILLYSSAHAAETISAGKAEVPHKETAGTLLDILSGGSASILESAEVEEAKEKAIEKAKNEAVLKVIGLYVNSETLSKEKANLTKSFKAKQDEFISEYKIVSEERGEDGFYRVKISSKIREDAVKAFLMQNLRDDRVIVITSEKNMGNRLKRHILEHDLNKLVKGKGYSIVDYRTIRNKTVGDLVSAIRQGNTEAVKKLGVYYLTDIVIVGFVEAQYGEQTKEIYSARATGQVKIHQIGGKKEILSLTKHNEKGFGSDRDRAGIDALKKVSTNMSNDVKKGLPIKGTRKITLKIREIGSHATLQKAKDMLSRMPYVKEVTEGVSNFSMEESTLYVKTTKGIDYISGMLDKMNAFVIKKVKGSEIMLEARKI